MKNHSSRKESSELLYGRTLQCTISFKVCSRCGGSGAIKKERKLLKRIERKNEPKKGKPF
jgi:hypothetical protein